MANDELMRLAERVQNLSVREDTDGGTFCAQHEQRKIAADLRALSQRAPQNGAVPEGWRMVLCEPTDTMIEAGCAANVDRANWPAAFGAMARRIRRKNMRAAWAAMLAAAPAPEAAKCACGVSTCVEPWEPGCGLGNSEEFVVAAPEAETLDESLKRTIREISDEITPEAERAHGEATTRSDGAIQCMACGGWNKPGCLACCDAFAWPAPPPAGQPEGVEAYAYAVQLPDGVVHLTQTQSVAETMLEVFPGCVVLPLGVIRRLASAQQPADGDIATIAVEMHNFADVADRCDLTAGNAQDAIRSWAWRLQRRPQSAGSEQQHDTARLDYIERTFSGMTNRERYLPVQMIWGKGANGRTLREACDKYMARDAGNSQESDHA